VGLGVQPLIASSYSINQKGTHEIEAMVTCMLPTPLHSLMGLLFFFSPAEEIRHQVDAAVNSYSEYRLHQGRNAILTDKFPR